MSTSVSTPLPSTATGVIVASPNEILRRQVIENLHFSTHLVQEASGGADALAKLESGKCRVLMLDRSLSDLDCDDVVKMVGTQHPSVEVILLDSGSGSATLPFTGRQLAESLAAPRKDLEQVEASETMPGLIGTSPAILRVVAMMRRVAKRETTVLLTGETGTGKEVIAQAIHRLSPRSNRPFVTVNCAAIPEALLESELFGYVRGAFTGAVQSRMGRLHTAHGGVLFLDEIGEMPMGLQSKLLRFLEAGEVQRLGSPDVFRVDVRVIAATNANLAVRIAERQFREDLYYRLAVFPIELPPLRSRGADVLKLAQHFLEGICGKGVAFDNVAEQWLLRQVWRGNVRELRHCIERASVLWDGEGQITVQHLQS
jgi:transcriptional regulator with GAF, ATPase, and Fis domain